MDQKQLVQVLKEIKKRHSGDTPEQDLHEGRPIATKKVWAAKQSLPVSNLQHRH